MTARAIWAYEEVAASTSIPISTAAWTRWAIGTADHAPASRLAGARSSPSISTGTAPRISRGPMATAAIATNTWSKTGTVIGVRISASAGGHCAAWITTAMGWRTKAASTTTSGPRRDSPVWLRVYTILVELSV